MHRIAILAAVTLILLGLWFLVGAVAAQLPNSSRQVEVPGGLGMAVAGVALLTVGLLVIRTSRRSKA